MGKANSSATAALPSPFVVHQNKIKCFGNMKVKSVDFLRGNMCVII